MIYASVPDDNFASTIDARASQLANGPTKAYKYIKQAMRASFDNSLHDQLALEAELQGRAGKTRDFTEGVHELGRFRHIDFVAIHQREVVGQVAFGEQRRKVDLQ